MMPPAVRLTERGPCTIADARLWSIDSERVGRVELSVALPPGEAPTGGWPAVLLLEGESSFGTCVEAVRRMSRRSDATGVAPMAIIGITCADHADKEIRRRDFGLIGRADSGQANGGLAGFIEHELLPALTATFAVDGARLALFGHSLAGYFVLRVLAEHSHCFRHYAAISPSIWWDRDGLEETLHETDLAGRRAFIAIGEWEGALPPWQSGLPGSTEALARRESRRMMANARELAGDLAARMGEGAVQFALFDNEDHASIITRAMAPVLRFVSAAPLPD